MKINPILEHKGEEYARANHNRVRYLSGGFTGDGFPINAAFGLGGDATAGWIAGGGTLEIKINQSLWEGKFFPGAEKILN